MSDLLLFRVFQDFNGDWQEWNAETLRLAKANHIRNKALGIPNAQKWLDCLARGVKVYAESSEEAIRKVKNDH